MYCETVFNPKVNMGKKKAGKKSFLLGLVNGWMLGFGEAVLISLNGESNFRFNDLLT